MQTTERRLLPQLFALLAVMALSVALAATFGKDNAFGFACFIAFLLAGAALVIMGIRAFLDGRRRSPRPRKEMQS
jgi:peptidoglycan/LPS O-acetylase OafA/YrhL